MLNIISEDISQDLGWHTLPSSELHPGPPFSQIVTSSTGGPSVGWNTKNSARDGSSISIGMRPEYISPMS